MAAKMASGFLALLALLCVFSEGQCRSLLDETTLQLFQPGVETYTVTAGVGETSDHAARAAAVDLATVLEDVNLWEGVEGGPNCTVTCNGGNVTEADDNGSKPYSCWGHFKAFCKGHGEKGCGAAGFKCDGHWVGFKTPGGGRAAICEGDARMFAVKFFKYEGKKIAAFKKGGCLGTASVFGKNKSSDSTEAISWPAELPQQWDASYDGMDVLNKALNKANSEEPLGQGRCTGFSGSIKAVKVKKGCSEGECEEKENKKIASKIERKGMDFVKLEHTVNETLAEMGMSLELPTVPAPFSLDMSPQFACSRGPKCEILCNGRPAWFKGAFPCFGKLTIECEAGEDAPKFAPDFIAASCKGFWSGILGRRCKGQAASFIETKYVDKLGICTGQFGMFAKAKKAEGKFAYGSFCKGKRLNAIFVGDEEHDDDDSNNMIAA